MAGLHAQHVSQTQTVTQSDHTTHALLVDKIPPRTVEAEQEGM